MMRRRGGPVRVRERILADSLRAGPAFRSQPAMHKARGLGRGGAPRAP